MVAVGNTKLDRVAALAAKFHVDPVSKHQPADG
jgi:hypothetical protein